MNIHMGIARTSIVVFLLMCSLFYAITAFASDSLCTDNDNDGYSREGGDCGAVDCDDNDPNEHPDQVWYKDKDKDGYSDGKSKIKCNRPKGYKIVAELASISGDCNDKRALINPGAKEVCDNKDNNCNGQTDEDLTRITTCGVGVCSGNSGTETCVSGEWSNNTCNRLSGASMEICDGLDNDCNGKIDEGVKNTYYKDADGDGYGNLRKSIKDCTQPADYVTDKSDCDDNDPNEHPDQVWYKDKDNDGYSDGKTKMSCKRPRGYKMASELMAVFGDCNDKNAAVNPEAEEGPFGASLCSDNKDNDCDGLVDAQDPVCICQASSCPPQIIDVGSSVLSDTDNNYATGKVVRIDVLATSTEQIVGGTIRITSQSQGYDSGVQNLMFGSIFYLWDTTGLNSASDYKADITLVDAAGQAVSDDSLVVKLAPNPPSINKLVSEMDVSVPAEGFPVNIVRTYLLDSTFDGPIGYGWTHSYRMRAVETPTYIWMQAVPAFYLAPSPTRIKVDGVVQIFNADGTGSSFQPIGDGSYQSPKGDDRTLNKLSDGSYILKTKYGSVLTFDSFGKLASVSDQNSNTQTLGYDEQGRLTTITDASGQITTFSYNESSRISAIIDPYGRIVSYSYDGVGNLVSVTNNAGFITTYAYNVNRNLTTITDPTGKRTFFTVNADDRLQSVSGENNSNRVTFQYSTPSPDKMTIIDALGNSTVFTYDNNALVTQVLDSLGNTSSFTYDDDFNRTSVTDTKGNQSIFTYDSRGNLLSSMDAAGNVVSLSYDPVFNKVTSLTDAKGQVTSFSYDSRGNRIRMTYPNGSIETFTYDSLGNLTSKTDRKGKTIKYAYNSMGRLKSSVFPDGSSDTFGYDIAGNLITATDENGTISFNYDVLDRITQVAYPGGEVVSYSYDASGNRTSITYPDGMVLNYQYDSLNRLTAIKSGANTVASYTYDLLSRVTRRDLENGTFTTYTYDNANQLIDLVNRKSTNEIVSIFGYSYDALGNRLSMTTQTGTTTYVYDAINQLIDVTEPGGIITGYNLDPAGNRTSVVDSENITNYTTNNLNQYTNVGGNPYTYDANGNLTSITRGSEVTTFTYDYQDLLIQVDTPTETIDYTYDLFGRRTFKTTSAGITEFIHDGMNVIMEVDTEGAVIAKYIYGRNIDEILLMQREGTDYYYSHDGLGSVTDLTDSSQSVVESFSYDAYGTPSSASSVGNPYLFAGREYEPETGLYFYRARYYSPETGRFISFDPIGFRGGVNLYAYVKNNPVNYTDPLGLVWISPNRLKPPPNCVIGCTIENVIYVDPKYRDNIVVWTHEYLHAYFWEIGDFYTSIMLDTDPYTNLWPYTAYWQNVTRDFLNNYPGYGQDTDGDGLYDLFDPCPKNADCDGDGLTDKNDPCPEKADCDGDGLPDGKDPCPQKADCDGDGIPDGKDPDPTDPTNPSCKSNPSLCTGDPTFVQVSRRIGSPKIVQLLAGNKSTSESDRTKDIVARIDVPYSDALVRAQVPVFGIAGGMEFKEYRVEYGEGENPAEWILINHSTSPQDKVVTAEDLDDATDMVIHGNLATWDTGLGNYVYLPTYPKDHPVNLKGIYTLRLVVTGKDGKTAEDRVTVEVANVIPNAMGGKVTSKDNKVILSVPEQSIMDSFRLISIKPADQAAVSLPEGRKLIGTIYEAREADEQFTKEANLKVLFSDEEIGNNNHDKLGIFAFNSKKSVWEHLHSYRILHENAIYTNINRLHTYYALMVSTLPDEGSVLESAVADSTEHNKINTDKILGDYLVKDTFEYSQGGWSNRDGEVGAYVSFVKAPRAGGAKALQITNKRVGGNFAVNVVRSPFDAREFPVVKFDYRIAPDVKTNFLVKVSGRWYEIGFTDDYKELRDKRVNIAHIGDIGNIITDNKWHTAKFNLYDMLRTKTGNTVVEEMIMADWDVSGYMKLQLGHNARGATYYIDNFSIAREASIAKTTGDVIEVDNFNQKQNTNALGGYAFTFNSSNGGGIEADFAGEDVNGSGNALNLHYDVSKPESYAGYVSSLDNLDLRDYQVLSLFVKASEKGRNFLVGLKDHSGNEQKISINQYLPKKSTAPWLHVTIPLVAFTDIKDWSGIENISLSFENSLHDNGEVIVDSIDFRKEITSLIVDNFEEFSGRNLIGGIQTTFVSGAAAINGQYTKGSPNGLYRISYGGNIGAINAYASDLKSFAGWTTDLGGINCSQCGTLSFRIRGAEGGENATISLDDGNFRWGVELAKYVTPSTSWQKVEIPLREFAEYGVDLTHLAELKVIFEGVKMSGTIYLDDIQFEAPKN